MKWLFINNIKKLSLFIILFFYINSSAQQYSQSWKDVNYAGDANVYHMLDIYLPQVEKPSYPVVIIIYGSAWLANNLKGSDLSTLGKALLDAGFAIVMPNYRSSMDAKFPAQIHDIKAVIRFVRANADKYNIDTSFIGITGSSSGGSMAAVAGTSRYVKEFTVGNVTLNIEGNLGAFTNYSSSVNAVVDWFGPTNMLVMDSCGTTSMVHNSASSPASLYIGGPIQENKEKCLLASPTTYIDSGDPPFLIFHGDKDNVVPFCQSEILWNELQKAGVKSQFISVPGGGHGMGMFVDKYFKMMIDFFKKESGITKVDVEGKGTPAEFSVSQNYPNPFNPATTITFSIPNKSFVRLEVFDSLGREVSELVSTEMLPGTYSRQWNAEGMPSGVYFYRLEAGSHTETKKIILLK
jgi:acetyl esterase/lipase